MTNKYSIYWIEEEVAENYYHKSDILLRFLEEYGANPTRRDLKAQFIYITHQIHFHEIITHLNTYRLKGVTVYSVENRIFVNKHGISIYIQVEDGMLHFQSKNLQEAVLLLFPMLHDFYPFLFVQGKNVPNYGWVSPITQKSNVQMRQVLYSHR